jgi:hypothetical protein
MSKSIIGGNSNVIDVDANEPINEINSARWGMSTASAPKCKYNIFRNLHILLPGALFRNTFNV